MSAEYGPNEATIDDVDLARVDAMGAGFIHGEHSFEAVDAELDLAYTEASYQRGHLGRWAECLPDTPHLYDEAETGIEAGS
jgi:hypothetical protein